MTKTRHPRFACLAAAAGLILFMSASAFSIPADAASIPPADPSVPTLNQASEAARSLSELFNSKPPMLADPSAAALFKVALDERVFAEMQQRDLLFMSGFCAYPAQLLNQYALYQTGAGNATALTVQQTGLAVMNSVHYQNEIARLTRFSVACGARVVPAAETFWTNLPSDQRTEARRQGISMMRQGLAMMYSGVVLMQVEATTNENRKLVLDAAIEFMNVYAGALGLPERQAVIAQIDRFSPSKGLSDETREKLSRIRDAMSADGCTGLCAD